MTTFSNSRQITNVESTLDSFNLTGEVQFDPSCNRVTIFSGTVLKEGFNAYFNYLEDTDGNVNISINSVPKSAQSAVEGLISSVVADIHTEFDVVSLQ